MKNLFYLLLFATTGIAAQTGLSIYAMPTGYVYSQTIHKNAITTDNAGNVWVGFNQIGLGRFNGTTWTMFDMSNTPFNSDKITALGVQNGTNIWVATQVGTTASGGVYRYNGSTWTDYSSVLGLVVKSIATDNAGNIYFGSNSGVARFDGVSSWLFYTAASGLASDSVLCLAKDAATGHMLAGTKHGLSDMNGASVTNYTSANFPFTNDAIQALYSDATNGTWLSAGGKVGRFAPPYYTPVDSMELLALPFYPANNVSITKGPHGGVIFSGGQGGLVEFNGNSPSFYYPPSISQTALLSYNTADGKTWIINQQGNVPQGQLLSFDGNYAHHLGEGTYGVTPANCRYLDINEVRTAILNRGDKNWNLSTAQYMVPKEQGPSAVFNSSLWIGGMDNGGTLHEAAMTYRQRGMDFFPGPLDTLTGTTDSATAVHYDYIWKIQKLQVQEFQYNWSIGTVQNGSYTPDADLLSWPAQGTGNFTRNLAPFIDVDGNGVYNPLTGGDYPDIKGDEMLYCIYNDNLAAHTETGAAPLKVEVHASAYEYYCPSIADSQKVLNYTTYYHYEIYNRSGVQYNNAYLGLYHDGDLGAYDDDYVGCVSSENFSFTSNGDDYDGNPPNNWPQYMYGQNPPITAYAVLDGPPADPGDGIDNDNDGILDEAGEKNLMTGHVYYNNDFSVTGNPEHADDYYLFMSGHWKDSTYVTYGGNGYGGTTPVRFMYDGLPYDTAAWTEASEHNTPFDRRNVTSAGPFTLQAGQEVNFDYAIVYSRDTTVGPPDTLYYDQAVNDVRRVRNWYNANSTPSCVQWNVGIHEPAAATNELVLYPNPASTLLTIAYKTGSKNARYEVIDLTGRVLESNLIREDGLASIPVEDFAAGIYLVRIIDGTHSTAKKFIKQ